MNAKELWPRICWKLSPELSDGSSCAFVDNEKAVIAAIEIWLTEIGGVPGESFSVEAVEMTKEQFDALPDL